MPVQQRLKGGYQIRFVRGVRQADKHGLAEAANRTTALEEPAHDGSRCDPSRAFAEIPCSLSGTDRSRDQSERSRGLLLENVANADFPPGTSCPTHQLNGQDAIAAQTKEAVVQFHLFER